MILELKHKSKDDKTKKKKKKKIRKKTNRRRPKPVNNPKTQQIFQEMLNKATLPNRKKLNYRQCTYLFG